MITLRLFHRTDPFREIETRTLAAGELTIGRDAAAQWRIADPDCEVSRQHCVLSFNRHGATVRDTSSNGVFLGNERRRIDRDQPISIAATDTVHLGQYIIVIEGLALSAANDAPRRDDASPLDAPFHLPMLQSADAGANGLAAPSDWVDPPPPPCTRAVSDATLLDAFCAGARLDASSFAGEDPAEVMRRIGAVYQHMVLGLGDLLSERSSLKTEYRMDRTTVGAAGNNPFKWAPTQRVAIDLLRQRDDGFLSGAAALKASFIDLKKHLLCLMAGSRAAVTATLDHLDPAHVKEAEKHEAHIFVSRSEAHWRSYKKRHETLSSEARANPDSAINRAFKAGYEQQLRQLDELGTHA